MYVDISCHFESLNKRIKTKASLGPQCRTGEAVG